MRRCAACLTYALVLLAAAAGVAHAGSRDALGIQLSNDRLTLSFTGVPQVYLFGPIDARAVERVGAMIRSGRIPHGSDIYLDSASGDAAAGMALGRLFRDGGMPTHLGAPRKIGRRTNPDRDATCAGACALAYLGGEYRFAPAGGDRFGLSQAVLDAARAPANRADAATSYLDTMGIDLAALAAAPTSPAHGTRWLGADAMIRSGLANNGELAPTAHYNLASATPTLELKQQGRRGEHRISFLCRPGSILVTAQDEVGAARAKRIVARRTPSYLQADRQQLLPQAHEGVSAQGNAVVIQRSYPPDQLVRLFSAHALGAWVADTRAAFRDGFSLPLYPVRHAITGYYNACFHAAPWRSAPAAQAH